MWSILPLKILTLINNINTNELIFFFDIINLVIHSNFNILLMLMIPIYL